MGDRVDFNNLNWKAVAALLRDGYAIQKYHVSVREVTLTINDQKRHSYAVMNYRNADTSQSFDGLQAYYDSAEDAAKAFVDAVEAM